MQLSLGLVLGRVLVLGLMDRKGCEMRCGGPRCRAWRRGKEARANEILDR